MDISCLWGVILCSVLCWESDKPFILQEIRCALQKRKSTNVMMKKLPLYGPLFGSKKAISVEGMSTSLVLIHILVNNERACRYLSKRPQNENALPKYWEVHTIHIIVPQIIIHRCNYTCKHDRCLN